jgi:hypothetical protein
MRFENVTLYVSSDFGFGYCKPIECKWLEIETKPYAQYPVASHVRFLEKRKRTVRGFVRHGINRGFVVLAGWSHPDLRPDPFEDKGDGVLVSRGLSFDPVFASEFDANLSAYCVESCAKVVHDSRFPDAYPVTKEEGAA